MRSHSVTMLGTGRAAGPVRRLVLHLPVSVPDAAAWRRIALSLGARPG